MPRKSKRKNRTYHEHSPGEILTLLDYDTEKVVVSDDVKRYSCCQWNARKWCDVILLVVLSVLAFTTIMGTGVLFYLDAHYGSGENVQMTDGSVTNRLSDETAVHGKVILEYFFYVDEHEYFGAVWLKVDDYGSSGMNITERLSEMEKEYPPGGLVHVFYRKDQPGVNLAIFSNYLAISGELFLYKWISFVMTGTFLIMIFVLMVIVYSKK